MKFRSKTVIVEAVQLLWTTWSEVCELIDSPGGLKAGNPEGCYIDAEGNVTEDSNGRIGLKIPVPGRGHPVAGIALGVEGDWIVRRPDGTICPIKPERFEADFEQFDERESLELDRDDRQRAVFKWVGDAFGQPALTPRERALRVFEEAVELAQAEGIAIEGVRAVAEHVFGKPPGDPAQEAGGIGVTLLAYCAARGISADAEEVREFDRVLAVDPAHFRARHNKKADAGIAVRVRVP